MSQYLFSLTILAASLPIFIIRRGHGQAATRTVPNSGGPRRTSFAAEPRNSTKRSQRAITLRTLTMFATLNTFRSTPADCEFSDTTGVLPGALVADRAGGERR